MEVSDANKFFALSTMESENTDLLYALQSAIPPIMEQLKEMKEQGFPIRTTVPKIHCQLFEYNSGAFEIANTQKYRPRTKHINVKLHHFRDYVSQKEISIHPINTLEQLADYLTKPVNLETLIKLQVKVMGW
jgi:hypothetical protein